MTDVGKSVLSSEQCRAARALLNWSRARLCDAANVAMSTVADFEANRRQPYDRTLRDLRSALEAAGVVFTDDEEGTGVKLRSPK